MRGLPCTITENPWYVSGMLPDGSGGGVLEWCYDEEDACAMLRVLAESGHQNLSAYAWSDRESR